MYDLDLDKFLNKSVQMQFLGFYHCFCLSLCETLRMEVESGLGT